MVWEACPSTVLRRGVGTGGYEVCNITILSVDFMEV